MEPTATLTAVDMLNQDRTDELEDLLASDRDHDRVADRLERETASLKRFRVTPDEDIDYAPGDEGQYITITHDTGEEEIERHYSLANSAQDYEETGELELCVRLVEDGAFTPTLFDMEEGDRLDIDGPSGHFQVDPDPDKETLIIATGTGIAPFKAGIEGVYDEIVDGEQDVTLVHGARWEDDLAYKDEFEQLADEGSMEYIPTLSGEPDWDGEDRYVQDVATALFEDDELDPDSTEVYICGLKAMVNETAYRMTGKEDKADGPVLKDPIGMQDLNFERYD